jgi:aspartate oxidase
MKDENWRAEGVETATGKRRFFGARALIMATGGASALYRRHDNPRGMLGDGYILALNAGARLQDMEFVQFYPLGLAEPGLPPFIIPPGLADRGRLLNGAGEDIHDKYDIHERPAAELARDALSRALFIEIERLGQDVWLDARSVPAEGWRADPFSASTEKLLGERYGAKHRPLRVAPMAHHVMGGVSITSHCETSVPGLFAAGEVTGGLHGANRMGGNALTETMVFGKRAGEAAAAWSFDRPAVRVSPPPAGRREPVKAGREKNFDADDLMRRLQDIMWREGGIMRSPGGLHRALSAVSEWEEAVDHGPWQMESRSVQRQIDLRIALKVAALVLQAALRRRESRGAHFREDFPAQSDSDWLGHLHVERISADRNAWRFVLSRPQGHDGQGC